MNRRSSQSASSPTQSITARGALAVGLDGQPEPVPPGERRVGRDGGDHVERQLQPVRFLGVDGEIEVECAAGAGQPGHARHQLAITRARDTAS